MKKTTLYKIYYAFLWFSIACILTGISQYFSVSFSICLLYFIISSIVAWLTANRVINRYFPIDKGMQDELSNESNFLTKIGKLSVISTKINDPEIKNFVSNVVSKAAKLCGRPHRNGSASAYFTFYIDQLITILEQYNSLQTVKTDTKALLELKPILIDLISKYNLEVNKDIKNKEFELDVDIKLLKHAIKN